MSLKRKADRHDGPIESHPEVGDDKPYKIVKSELVLVGKNKRRMVTLVRVADNHPFTMRYDNFCDGKRPLAKFVYQLECIVSGEFTLVNEEDLQLGQGFNKKIKLVRTRDNHEFTMRCDNFCLQGNRPPDKLVYQLECIVSGEFTLVNDEDAQLGQGNGKKITLVRTRDQRHITERCDMFCSRICFHCLEMSHCTYAQNTCASCWCVQYPGAALAVTPMEGNKTEILVAAMLEAHLGRVSKEPPTRDDKREDVVLMSTMLCVAIDGAHHFVDTDYGPCLISCSEVQRVDTDKCRWWLADHPGASYVRMPQRPAWRGYPVNQLKPISFDFVNAIDYVNQNPDLYGGKVVFLEKTDRPTLYGEHRRLLDVESIEHVTLDPRTIDYGPNRITEDKRTILSQ